MGVRLMRVVTSRTDACIQQPFFFFFFFIALVYDLYDFTTLCHKVSHVKISITINGVSCQ